MERKIIIGMLVSIVAVAALIFCIKQVTGDGKPSDSTVDTPPTIQTSETTTTDFWDYLHGQTETTTTTVATDENGNPVTTTAATDENGDLISTEATTTTSQSETTTTTQPVLVFPG